jgi:hypothetical protein
MALAYQTKLPVTFTGADDLPLVRVDPIMPDEGLLMLLDLTHPSNPIASGVPADGSTIPNLAWEQAAAAIGSGTRASLAAEVYNVGLSGSKGLVERTAKGALHGIVSPTYAFPTDFVDGLNIAVAQAIYDYTRANPTHHYYFSLWRRPTRTPTATASIASINTTAQWLISYNAGSNVTTGTLNNASSLSGDPNTDAPKFRNVEVTPASAYGTDTVSATQSPGHRSVFMVGNRHVTNGAAGQKGKTGSRAFYRATLEDLTISAGPTPR